MKTTISVILQAQNNQSDHTKGWIVLIILLVIVISWLRKRIKKKSLDEPTISYNSISATTSRSAVRNTSSSTQEPSVTATTIPSAEVQQEVNEVEEYDDRFEKGIKRFSAEEWEINYDDINTMVTTSRGIYSITNDDEVYLDDDHVITMDNTDSYFVTPEGDFYFNDTEEYTWKKIGDTFSWTDYVKLAADDDEHPEGEIEYEESQVLLNGKVLYSGNYDTYTAHPNFGVIVADEHRVFINKHLNYEGYFDSLHPDPEGLVVKVDDDYYLIPKNIPTPDLFATLSEDEYNEITSNSDSDFVKQRITEIYSGRVLQQDFDGEVWVSEKGLLFVPSDKPGTLYLRDVMIHSSEGRVTNVVIDAENIFVEVDEQLWYRNGLVFFESHLEYVNYFGVIDDKDEEWDIETWPDGTVVRSKDEFIQKNGSTFLEAVWVAWYMHPKGIVIVDEEENIHLFPFAQK